MRQGVWVEARLWQPLTPEQRHAALVHATDLVCHASGDHVYAMESAAVWGLPRVDPWPAHVTVLASGPRTRGSRRIRMHVGAPAEPATVNGILVTPPARTVVDLARTGSLANGLSAADHALRHGLCSRTDLADAAAEVRPGCGRPSALLVAELADARSMSAGESLSRAVMFASTCQDPTSRSRSWTTTGSPGPRTSGGRASSVSSTAGASMRCPRVSTPRRPGGCCGARSAGGPFPPSGPGGPLGVVRRPGRAPLARILAEQGVRPQPRNTWIDLGSSRASVTRALVHPPQWR